MKKQERTQSANYSEHISDIKDIVSQMGDIIAQHPTIKDMNFGLFYQHGRIGFVDLDAFAQSTKARLNVDGEEKSLTELKEDIDKNEKE